MSRYPNDLGALDAMGRYIQEQDTIAIATNSGIRVGEVLTVKPREVLDYNGTVVGYEYSVTVQLEVPQYKRQTFPHNTMGEEKFWVIPT